jgi:hypothetical protein
MGVLQNQSHELAKRKIPAHAGDRMPVVDLSSISQSPIINSLFI